MDSSSYFNCGDFYVDYIYLEPVPRRRRKATRAAGPQKRQTKRSSLSADELRALVVDMIG